MLTSKISKGHTTWLDEQGGTHRQRCLESMPMTNSVPHIYSQLTFYQSNKAGTQGL
jgi:hypothetical protein